MSAHPKKTVHPSIARVQQDLEPVLLRRLEEENPEWKRVIWKDVAPGLGIPLLWQGTKPDAVWEEPYSNRKRYIIAECYVRIDPLKPGHWRKLAYDALKLISLQRAMLERGHTVRSLMVLPMQLKEHLREDRWLFEALKAVEPTFVALSAPEELEIRNATAAQGRGQLTRRNETRSIIGGKFS